MRTSQITAAALALAANRRKPGPMVELVDDQRPTSLHDAYRIQQELCRELIAQGWGARVGYKIGCTTPIMQSFLDIDHPCSGHLLATRVHQPSATLKYRSFHQPGVECELVARLGVDLRMDDFMSPSSLSVEDLGRCIGEYMAGIEVVDARYNDYRTVSTETLIADDFFQSAAVVGLPVDAARVTNLAAVRGRMRIDGRVVGAGVSRDILGHPMNALRWLAHSMAERGTYLRAGDIVFLGSVVQTQWLVPTPGEPTLVEVEMDGIGTARAKFES